jgi:hypothetical protein
MNRAAIGLALVLLWPVTAAAGDDSAKKLAGTWEAKDNPAHTWTFEQTGKGMHIVEVDNRKTVTDYVCNTSGRDCDIEREGRGAKVSLWYNGSALVEMMTEGSHVAKRRYAPASEGTALEVEVIPIVPEGRTEKLALLRHGDVQTARQR